MSGTATRLLVDHLERELGRQAMLDVVAEAGEVRPVEVLLDDASWSSYAGFRALAEAAARALGSVDELRRIHETTELDGGSMPEGTEALLALGSPSVLFAATGVDQNGLFTVTEGSNEQVSENEWLLRMRFVDGFAPYPEFCAFFSGMLAMGPLLFGRRVVTLVHETCQRDGDEWCTNRLGWADADESSVVSQLETKVRLLERRSETLQRTVADLVSADDLHTVLTRVVRSAARATRAPGFVLALEPMPYLPDRVYAHGLTRDEADDVARRLLEGDGALPAMVVEVASSQRSYGRLAALDPQGTVVQRERVLLESYARLAATALDSATALEEARRQGESARALLELSTVLAEVTTSEEMAKNVAAAIPVLLDCDAAAVVLVDDEGVARIVGTSGFVPAVDAMLRTVEMPVASPLISDVRFRAVGETDADLRRLLEDCGVAGYASIPVTIDGVLHGALVAAVTSEPERLVGNPELQERLTGLASQAATALRNARLLDQIRHQALHDVLTGLPNRALMMDRAEFLLQRAHREGRTVAALFIDLDGFKEVNDTLGHATGDALLCAVAGRLTGALRGSDTVSRLGGDEFVVLTDGTVDGGPEVTAARLLDVLRDPYELEPHDGTLEVTASIGIASGSDVSADELLRDADVALYQTKAAGKDGVTVFSPQMHAADRDRLALLVDLRGALRRNEFFLVYQPMFDLRNEAVTGIEALLRWQHPERGVVGPDVFIPLLEESRMIDEVGRWVLAEACRQTMVWHGDGHHVDVSVNISGRQLERDDVVRDVRSALDDSGLPAANLIVEITESVIMKDVSRTVVRLAALKDLGVRIAIDDFGTGYSSLAYLRQFPVDALKIDRSFIHAIADSEEAGVMISTLVQLGKALGLATFAEGIEERAQVDRLQLEECDSGQGFLFARPLLPEHVGTFLRSHPAAALT